MLMVSAECICVRSVEAPYSHMTLATLCRTRYVTVVCTTVRSRPGAASMAPLPTMTAMRSGHRVCGFPYVCVSEACGMRGVRAVRGSVASDLRASTRLAWLPSRHRPDPESRPFTLLVALTGVLATSPWWLACPTLALVFHLLKTRVPEIRFLVTDNFFQFIPGL